MHVYLAVHIRIARDACCARGRNTLRTKDYFAVHALNYDLSPRALTLYIYLDKLPTTMPWGLKESVVLSKTQLTPDGYDLALEELIRKGYLTPGEIHLNGKDYLTGSYHFWESPELNEDGHDFH
ncbi:MAG: hypothetical protein E7318_05290 [Clostridiales bacterium]|nr:hypothetical protein [Clostridiales bacterium]